MRIGIDFYDTITDAPVKFRRYIRQLKADGHEVFVISAIHSKNIDRLQKDFKRARLYCELVPVFFEHYEEVPVLKYKKCAELGIEYMIDDRLDTCRALYARGIREEHYKGWKDFNGRQTQR